MESTKVPLGNFILGSYPALANVPLLRAFLSPLDCIWGILKGSWTMLDIPMLQMSGSMAVGQSGSQQRTRSVKLPEQGCAQGQVFTWQARPRRTPPPHAPGPCVLKAGIWLGNDAILLQLQVPKNQPLPGVFQIINQCLRLGGRDTRDIHTFFTN